MKIDIITGFPEMFQGPFDNSIIWQARKRNLVDIDLVNLRDFATDNYRSIDDYPFGGGAGMVLKCEPAFAALEKILPDKPDGKNVRVVYPTPQGEILSQRKARELSLAEHLVFVSGRYKGIDERITRTWVTDEISIGDYVLSGGELAVMVIIDALVRLLPEVLNNLDSAQTDSFEDGLLDSTYYTRPASFRGMDVPAVLLSGDHKAIDEHRYQEKLERTKIRRPDLYKKYMEDK